MNPSFILEPKLDFGTGQHVDIRYGLMNYGPLDITSPMAPKGIKLGIIGTTKTIEGVINWFDKCQNGIPAKVSNQPNLFPPFPGFGEASCFNSQFIIEQNLQRSISHRDIDILTKTTNHKALIEKAVEMFYAEIEYLVQSYPVDVIICALPLEMIIAMEKQRISSKQNKTGDEPDYDIDFHHLLKAKAMRLRIPIQIMLPTTYDEKEKIPRKLKKESYRGVQDEATRAWNIHTALYYKAKGIPWRLIRDSKDITSCYVGISFYKTLDQKHILTSIAQIFNERGEGIIVRGGKVQLSKKDRQLHLTRDDAYELLDQTLQKYRAEHKNTPGRVVLHKSSSYSPEEIDGFQSAIIDNRISCVDLINISEDSTTRLFRYGNYPPLRGTFLSLSDSKHLFYTRGSIEFFTTYPGMYIPNPILIETASIEQTPLYLATEILALTKMNWNNTQFDGALPITLRAARQVSKILKYVGENDSIEPRYSFYM